MSRLQKCGHDYYWLGNYGSCMCCRAEKAETCLAAANAKGEELAALLWEARSYVTLQGHEGPSTGYLRDAYPEAAAAVDKLQDRISAALSGKVAG